MFFIFTHDGYISVDYIRNLYYNYFEYNKIKLVYWVLYHEKQCTFMLLESVTKVKILDKACDVKQFKSRKAFEMMKSRIANNSINLLNMDKFINRPIILPHRYIINCTYNTKDVIFNMFQDAVKLNKDTNNYFILCVNEADIPNLLKSAIISEWRGKTLIVGSYRFKCNYLSDICVQSLQNIEAIDVTDVWIYSAVE